MKMIGRAGRGVVVAVVVLLQAMAAMALEPQEVVVLANSRVKGSVSLARYYMQRRGIPRKNLILLRAPEREEISRRDYVRTIRNPVRRALTKIQADRHKEHRLPVTTLVSMYGIPLKIQQQRKQPEGRTLRLEERTMAAVDSELALVLTPHNLKGWLPNPWYVGNQGRKGGLKKSEVLLVSRLDGPGGGLVRRLIDITLATEKSGLKGRAYFDARGMSSLETPMKGKNGYTIYDHDLLRAAEVTKPCFATTVDNKAQLFGPGACPDAAIYCGWYSFARYVDSFHWVQGAIAWHMASAEARTLRRADSPVWMPNLLKRGVAVSIGPVYEPYIQSFPPPSLFLRCLLQRGMSVGEAWLLSSPVVSWQMIMVGDPLYQPFQNVRCSDE